MFAIQFWMFLNARCVCKSVYLQLSGVEADGVGFVQQADVLSQLILERLQHAVHLLDLLLQEHGRCGPEEMIPCLSHAYPMLCRFLWFTERRFFLLLGVEIREGGYVIDLVVDFAQFQRQWGRGGPQGFLGYQGLDVPLSRWFLRLQILQSHDKTLERSNQMTVNVLSTERFTSVTSASRTALDFH